MVITAALSWFLTSTPPSCETVAAAIALALANRTIPSSCLILISLSPHPGGKLLHRSCAALLGALSNSCLNTDYFFSNAETLNNCFTKSLLPLVPLLLKLLLLMKSAPASSLLHARFRGPAGLLHIRGK